MMKIEVAFILMAIWFMAGMRMGVLFAKGKS